MNGTETDRSVQGYRAAADALDERPSAATRQAILVAAARHAESQPRDARDPVAPAKPRQRWPYAAAAAVLLSTLAVMMATRTEREMPTFTAPTTEAGRAGAPASEPVTPAKPNAAARTNAEETSQRTTSVAKRALRESRQQPAPPAAPAPPAVATGEAKQTELSAPAEAFRAKEETAARRAPSPEDRARAEAPRPAADGALAPPAKPQTVPLNASAEHGRDEGAADSRSVPQTAAPATPASESDPSASQWLERIVKLRRAGRHEEAEAELERFRERFPQVKIPPEAQAPAGTR
jgi:hypothetical protein